MTISKSFRTLNRFTCRIVLDQLRRGPKSVGEITAQIKFGSRSHVSQALALLLDAGLVSRRREGRQNFYRLEPNAFQELVVYLKGLYRSALKRAR